VVLTEGDGTHSVEYSPDRKFLIDSYSRVDMPAVTELRRAEDGKLVAVLERGNASALLETGWQAPEGDSSRRPACAPQRNRTLQTREQPQSPSV
jgi:hypothetical protein